METTEAIVEAVRAANAAFYRAIEARAIDQIEAVWSHEERVRCVHPGWDVLVGWGRVRESWENLFEGDEQMRISPLQVAVYHCGEMAWVSCIENITVFQENSFESVQATATNLFIHRNARWLMLHHHASPIPILVSDTASDTIQ